MAKRLISPAHRGFSITYIRCEHADTITRLVEHLQKKTPFRVTRAAVLGMALDQLAKAEKLDKRG